MISKDTRKGFAGDYRFAMRLRSYPSSLHPNVPTLVLGRAVSRSFAVGQFIPTTNHCRHQSNYLDRTMYPSYTTITCRVRPTWHAEKLQPPIVPTSHLQRLPSLGKVDLCPLRLSHEKSSERKSGQMYVYHQVSHQESYTPERISVWSNTAFGLLRSIIMPITGKRPRCY